MAKTVRAADVTFCRDGTYRVTVDGESFTARDVSLVDADNKTMLTCDLNGRTTRCNVVFAKDTVHLFTIVRDLLYLYIKLYFTISGRRTNQTINNREAA